MPEVEEKQLLIMDRGPEVSGGLYRAVFVLILIGAAALRLWHIGADELWLDETISAVTAMGSVKDIFAGTYSPKSPPVYYLLLHFWSALFGITEGALRGMSAAAGVGLVASVGYVGRRLFSRAGGLCAMCVAAVAPLGVHYSNEARAYILLALLALWHVYFMIMPGGRRGAGAWAGYVLTGIALAFTHIWGLFLLPAANAFFLLKPYRKEYLKLLAAQAVIAVVAVPFWLKTASGSSLEMAAWVSGMWNSLRPGEALLDTIEGLGAGGSYSRLIFRLYQPEVGISGVVNAFATIFFLMLLALGATRRGSGEEVRDPALGVLCALAVPLLIGYAISAAWQPVYLVGRTDFIVAPAFYLLAGAGLARLNPRLITVGAVIVALLASYNLSYFFTRRPFDAHRSTARYLIENAAPEDAVACTGNTCFPLMYYLPRYGNTREMIHYPSLEFSVATGMDPANMLAQRDELYRQAAGAAAAMGLKTHGDGKVYITTDRTRFAEVNNILFSTLGNDFRFYVIQNEDSGIPIVVYQKKR